jgi:hypothetical protein
MVPSPKVIGNIADIFENDLKELGIPKGDAVRIEAQTLNDFVPEQGYFGFNIAYRVSGAEKKNSILLPIDGLGLPKLEIWQKKSHEARYASLVAATEAVAEEMQRRGNKLLYVPAPFDNATFTKYAFYYYTTRIDFGPDAAKAHLIPHVLHPINAPKSM